eukprot:1889688-Amphidinium_carterae.2
MSVVVHLMAPHARHSSAWYPKPSSLSEEKRTRTLAHGQHPLLTQEPQRKVAQTTRADQQLEQCALDDNFQLHPESVQLWNCKVASEDTDETPSSGHLQADLWFGPLGPHPPRSKTPNPQTTKIRKIGKM